MPSNIKTDQAGQPRQNSSWRRHDAEWRVAFRNSDYLCALDGRSGRRSPTPCRTSDRAAIPASSAARRSASRNCSGAIFPLNASTQALTAATYSSPSSQGQSLIRRRAASPSVHTILRDAGPRKANPTGVNADDVFQHIVLDPSRHGYRSSHVQYTRVICNLELKSVEVCGLNASCRMKKKERPGTLCRSTLRCVDKCRTDGRFSGSQRLPRPVISGARFAFTAIRR